MKNSSNNIAFVDGSASPNKASEYSRGAAAAVLVTSSQGIVEALKIIAEYHQGFETVTNNRMELRAIELALQNFPNRTSFHLSSDSVYALNGLFGGNAAYANRELIEDIKDLILLKELTVTSSHIDGHQGHFLNELADYAAREAVEQKRRISFRLAPKHAEMKCVTCSAFPRCQYPSLGGHLEIESWKRIIQSLKKDEWKNCESWTPYVSVAKFKRPNTTPSGSIRS